MNADFLQYIYLIPVILISITFHEVMHGYVSYKLGDPTAKAMGRLTLNPIKHIDPIGLLMMFIAHIGWAKPVPINPDYYKNRKLGTIIVSLAGPLTNLALAFLFSIPKIYFELKYGQSASANLGNLSNFSLTNILYIISFFFVLLNIGLAIFNLFPIPPLDGSKILSGVLPTETYFRIMKYERYVGIVFLMLVILFPGAISSVLTPITEFFTSLFSGILSPLIKLFV